MKKRRVKIPIYHGDLTIYQVEDISKFTKEKFDFDFELSGDGVAFVDHDKGGYTKYVIVFDNDVTPNVIAHESLHTVNRIFFDRGILLDNENDEPQCYLLGWVVKQCYKLLLK